MKKNKAKKVKMITEDISWKLQFGFKYHGHIDEVILRRRRKIKPKTYNFNGEIYMPM